METKKKLQKSKGSIETILLSFLILIGFLGLMTVLIGQDIYTNKIVNNPVTNAPINVTISGINYENFKAPQCVFDWNPINDLYCIGAYLGFFTTLMTVSTDYIWLSLLIFIPIIAVLGYAIVRLLRGGG